MNIQSITTWIHGMQRGDSAAELQLWQACWRPVVERAREILSQRHRIVMDEQDIAASVLASLFRRAQAGEFSALNNSHDLWRLLWVIVERKVANHVEYGNAQCRNVGRTRHLSNVVDKNAPNELASASWLGRDPAQGEPIEAIALAETLDKLLLQLTEPMRRTVQLALEGHKPKEIANSMGVKVWTVYNHLSHVRNILERGLER